MDAILSMVLLLLLMILGIVYCFWGYKYLKITIMIFAVLGGGSFVYNLLSEAAPELGAGAWVIAIAVGLVLGLLAFFFIKFCIFLAGGILGVVIYNLVRGIAPEYFDGLEGMYLFLIGLAFFIIFGLITLAAKKHLIIVATAVIGAYAMTYIAGILIGLVFDPAMLNTATVTTAATALKSASVFQAAPVWLLPVIVIVLSIFGVVTQYRYTARGKKN